MDDSKPFSPPQSPDSGPSALIPTHGSRLRRLCIITARSAAVIFLLASSALLALDGLIFGVRMEDPAQGRACGCFTLLDDLLGTRVPNDALRMVELFSPVLALALGYAVVFWKPGSNRLG